MHYFYLQQPPSYKHFNPWNVICLLSLLESWALISSCNNLKLPWKMATIFALVIATFHSDLTFLSIDN